MNLILIHILATAAGVVVGILATGLLALGLATLWRFSRAIGRFVLDSLV